MSVKIMLVIGLFPLIGFASGNVNSLMKFPPKAKAIDTENEKCEANETLKACMERIKSGTKKNGGGK